MASHKSGKQRRMALYVQDLAVETLLTTREIGKRDRKEWKKRMDIILIR